MLVQTFYFHLIFVDIFNYLFESNTETLYFLHNRMEEKQHYLKRNVPFFTNLIFSLFVRSKIRLCAVGLFRDDNLCRQFS